MARTLPQRAINEFRIRVCRGEGNLEDGLTVDRAVSEGLRTLRKTGKSCDVTVEDLERWFQADTVYPDISLDEVIRKPFLVVHEIVEIDEIKRMGLHIEKDVIVSNLRAVEEAHCSATKVELEIAYANGNREHIVDRIGDIERWCIDPLVEPDMRSRYLELLTDAKNAAQSLDRKRKKRRG